MLAWILLITQYTLNRENTMTLTINLLIANIATNFAIIAIVLYCFQKYSRKDIITILLSKLESIESFNNRLESTFRQENMHLRTQRNDDAKDLREELNKNILALGQSLEGRFDSTGRRLDNRLSQFSTDQSKNFKDLTTALSTNLTHVTQELRSISEKNDTRIESVRKTIEERLDILRSDNSNKLEQMRLTVDEKLQGTLDKRLGESFKQVSQQLDQVHQGLGEMQTLAVGVGDLKRVLTNVKSRGGWAEVQLGALLDQMLSPEQYLTNARIKEDTQQSVEFAIRIPINDDEILLPIDAKFPHEDYDRLTDAMERAHSVDIEQSTKQLMRSIKNEAKRISEKYVHPPKTTEYAIMYLPTEGLYAEVVRQPGLVSEIQLNYRVTITGPTTLTAVLNSLQMGFRSLAIQQHSSEVWKVLDETKSEFQKFGGVLTKVKSHIDKASNTLDQVDTRTRVINRKLKNVTSVEVIEQPENSSDKEPIKIPPTIN